MNETIAPFICHTQQLLHVNHIADQANVDTFAIMQSLARDDAGSSARSVMETPTMSSSKPAAFAKKTAVMPSQTLAVGVAPAVPAPVKKGTVRFAPSLRIRPIPSLSFMSEKEKREIWYYVSATPFR